MDSSMHGFLIAVGLSVVVAMLVVIHCVWVRYCKKKCSDQNPKETELTVIRVVPPAQRPQPRVCPPGDAVDETSVFLAFREPDPSLEDNVYRGKTEPNDSKPTMDHPPSYAELFPITNLSPLIEEPEN